MSCCIFSCNGCLGLFFIKILYLDEDEPSISTLYDCLIFFFQNKDGLLYIEVEFDGKKKEGNQIIHGENEKTDYATVEFPKPSISKDADHDGKM